MKYLFLFLIYFIFVIGCSHKKSGPDPKAVYKKWCNAKIEFKGFEHDKDAKPISRVEPQYPRGAAQKGIEACVYVAFDINEQGKPVNVRILKSFPEKYGFEGQTAKAILGWRYQKEPKKNVLVKLDYKLE